MSNEGMTGISVIGALRVAFAGPTVQVR
jgi:hypothetical protein